MGKIGDLNQLDRIELRQEIIILLIDNFPFLLGIFFFGIISILTERLSIIIFSFILTVISGIKYGKRIEKGMKKINEEYFEIVPKNKRGKKWHLA